MKISRKSVFTQSNIVSLNTMELDLFRMVLNLKSNWIFNTESESKYLSFFLRNFKFQISNNLSNSQSEIQVEKTSCSNLRLNSDKCTLYCAEIQKPKYMVKKFRLDVWKTHVQESKQLSVRSNRHLQITLYSAGHVTLSCSPHTCGVYCSSDYRDVALESFSFGYVCGFYVRFTNKE